jgi:hypothetical protein
MTSEVNTKSLSTQLQQCTPIKLGVVVTHPDLQWVLYTVLDGLNWKNNSADTDHTHQVFVLFKTRVGVFYQI